MTDSRYSINALEDVMDSEGEAMKQGCLQKFRFFLKHSYRDICRHPCHFCLAFCSTFIVVLSSLLIQTVIDQGPIIFVSLAQLQTGDFDVWYSS